MNIEDLCQKNYQMLIESMQEAAQELGVGCPRIRFQGMFLEGYLRDVENRGYFPSSNSYEEVSIGGADVRLKVRGDGLMHIQLNIGRIEDNQGFYEALWKNAMKKELPLTMSDRDPQYSNQDSCQEFGFYR